MMDSPMNASLRVFFETLDFGDEAASVGAAAAGCVPKDADHLWGQIILDSPGQPTLILRDDLTMLGLALCVNVPAALTRDGRATLRLADRPVDYSFTAARDTVQVTGSQGDAASFHDAALMQALQACGLRLSAFMTALAASCPQYAFSAQALADRLK